MLKKLFNANTISSNNKQILKETPENENETHSNKYNNIIKNDIQRNMIYKKNINNNNINKNGKNNINLKKVDPSFMRNAKKEDVFFISMTEYFGPTGQRYIKKRKPKRKLS